jgi:predicted nucleic acid-binding Zn ribbon protein
MPMYEYRCDQGHEFSVEQGIKDDALTECTRYVQRDPGNTCAISTYECKAPVQRLISQSSFILKGGGWTPKGGL